MTTYSRKFWKSPEFKNIKSEWYEKLKDEGFVDIENRSMEACRIRGTNGTPQKLLMSMRIWFDENAPILERLDQLIMFYYYQNFSLRRIIRKLKADHDTTVNIWTVCMRARKMKMVVMGRLEYKHGCKHEGYPKELK